MKIAHLMSHPTLNGVASSTKMLIDAQLQAGHEVMLVHPRDSWIETQSFAGPVVKLESTFKTWPADLRATGYAIQEWGRTLVHAHGSRGNKYAMIYRLADGVPTVMTAHARKYQIPWMFAHAVVGLSQQTTDYYLRRRLVLRRNIHVVPNVFDGAALSPVTAVSRYQARRTLGIKADALLLGSVGLVSRRKRQTDMVEVLRALVIAGHDAQLLVIGDLPTKPDVLNAFRKAVDDPVVAGRVHLTGHRSDAVSLIPAIDVYLCTSEAEEAPIAPLEAMAQGVPVISTDVGNMADLLLAGRIFAIGDIDGMVRAAELLLSDERLRWSEGAAARRTVLRTLSADLILPRIEAVYRAALRSAHDRGRKPSGSPADNWHSTPAE